MIFLLGATGRLGGTIYTLAQQQEQVVISVQRKDLFTLETFQQWQKTASASPTPQGIWLDVSLPAATEAWTTFLEEQTHNAGAALPLFQGFVIGTTGLLPQTLERLKRLARHYPICVAPNFSRGIWLLEEIFQAKTTQGITVAELIQKLNFDVGLAEVHHKNKKDAPSGTALSLGKHFSLGAEKMSSLRVGDVVGEHRLVLGQPFEDITVTHQAHNRQTFAQGALDLCQALRGLPTTGRVLSPGEVMGYTPR
jgi:4-hydroxy-tetrahydrodipicolinate reductase